MIDLDTKPYVEKEFFKNYNNILENKKKIIIFNNKMTVENAVSSLIRYVIFNSKIFLIFFLDSNREANISLSLVRKSNSNVNEYIPAGPIVSQVSSNSVANIFTLNKFDTQKNWSEYEIEVKNEWSSSYSSNQNNNSKSNFTISVSGEPRYSGISSEQNQEEENYGSIEENNHI